MSSKRTVQKKQTIFVIVGIILLFLGIAAAVWFYTTQLKTYLSVGEYRYSKGAYEKLIAEAKADKVGEAEARKNIISGLSARAAADKMKLRYPTDDATLLAAVQKKFNNYKLQTPTEYQKIVSYPEIISLELKLAKAGGYKFALLDFPFSRYIVGFQRSDFGDTKLIHNKEAIQQDIQYAQQKKDAALAALKDKTKSIQQLVSETESDVRLVNGQYGNQSAYIAVTADGSRLDLDGVAGLNEDMLAQVKKAAEALNTPYVGESIFTVSPKEYGVGDLAIVQRDNHTLTGWRVIVVTDVYTKNASAQTTYETYKKEYENAAQ